MKLWLIRLDGGLTPSVMGPFETHKARCERVDSIRETWPDASLLQVDVTKDEPCSVMVPWHKRDRES